jgi:hypothetical protein
MNQDTLEFSYNLLNNKKTQFQQIMDTTSGSQQKKSFGKYIFNFEIHFCASLHALKPANIFLMIITILLIFFI